MFNLWNQVTGAGNNANPSEGLQHANKKDNDDRTINTSVTEDDTVDELLSQFPEYGTNVGQISDDEDFDNLDEVEEKSRVEDKKDQDGDSSYLEEMNESWLETTKSNRSILTQSTSISQNSSGMNLGHGVSDENLHNTEKKYHPSSDHVISSTKSHSNNPYWDEDEQDLWKSKSNKIRISQHDTHSSNNLSTKPASESSTHSFSQESMKNLEVRKEHWMPDSLCKNCCGCDAQFTVFRRRHHCRLCGQVFCNECSAYFVELAPDPTNLRKGQYPLRQNATHQDSMHPSHPQHVLQNHQERMRQKRTLRACKLCHEQVYSSADRHAALFGVGSKAAAGRWENEGDHYRMPDFSVSMSKSRTRHHRQSLSLTGAEIPIVNLEKSNSSLKSPLQGKKKKMSPQEQTPRSHRNANNISMSSTDLSAFLNKDENSYDESSFQALNLTKQRLEKRTAAAIKAGILNSSQQDHSAEFIEREIERQKMELEKDENEIQKDMDNEWNESSVGSANSTLQQVLQNRRSSEKLVGHKLGGDDRQSKGTCSEFDTIVNNTEDSNNHYLIEGSVHRPKIPILHSQQSKPLERIMSGQENDGVGGEHLDDDTPLFEKSLEHKMGIDTEMISASQSSPLANRKIGTLVALHLEQMAKELILSDAPLLLKDFPNDKWKNWIHIILNLVTRACSTVMPNVKGGDLLDIRTYCKVKVVAGGSPHDCAYVSGVVFHKNVCHKRMAKEVTNPRIMLLSGGIEYSRATNRIVSIETLLDQEKKYMEMLVAKIIGLKPCILLVGKSINRQAQEMLLKANIVLLQHVKSNLMKRIAKQTGATILSSSDHVMNRFGTRVLGKKSDFIFHISSTIRLILRHSFRFPPGQCKRFRLVTFRDKEAWSEQYTQYQRIARFHNVDYGTETQQNMASVLENLPNHQRQAVLAADRLGEVAMDGSLAVKSGLAKRGLVRTYVMLEGCKKRLGCTVVLRGASRATLKQVKRVFTFLLGIGYNLKLETSYYRERRVCLPVDHKRTKLPLQASSSLCVDYGKHPLGKKSRPWNGTNNKSGKSKTDVSRSISGKISALDYQSILMTSVWMADKVQCCPAEVKGICYYSVQDVSLGQFLRDSCFNLDLKCQNPTCKKSVLEHSLSFIHNDGRLNITVEKMDESLPPPPDHNPLSSSKNKFRKSTKESKSASKASDSSNIATWTYCTKCAKVVTPLVYISEETWNLSFGKFVEIYFYNRDFQLHTPIHKCSCQMQSNAILYFGCGNLAVRFTYKKIKPYGVFVRRSLPYDEDFHLTAALGHLETIANESSCLFLRFDKHIERISRELRQLSESKANKADDLIVLFSELNVIGSEVDHAAKTLQEKIGSISNSYKRNKKLSNDGRLGNRSLIRFPWHARRYLTLLTSIWNERLSAVGQTLTAMKKFAPSSQLKTPNGRGDMAVVGMNAAANAIVGENYGATSDDVLEGMKRVKQLQELHSQHNVLDMDIRSYSDHVGSKRHQRARINAQDRRQFGRWDDDDDLENDMLDLTDHEFDPYLIHEGNDSGAAVMRRNQTQKKSRSLRRSSDTPESHYNPISAQETSKNKTVTPGGAVKSALNRFFNRGSKEMDPYLVDLGIFAQGYLRLEPGIGGLVTPVYEDQPSTVIAYSLASEEYLSQFKKFSDSEGGIYDPNSLKDQGSKRYRESNKSKAFNSAQTATKEERKDIERRMLVRSKSHIKHTFKETDVKGQQICKYICTSFWSTQFHAVRQAFLEIDKEKNIDVEQTFIQSLSASNSWAASGGKSGASFSMTNDSRFVVKCISRTELQMFLDCAPAYLEYLSKAFFHGL